MHPPFDQRSSLRGWSRARGRALSTREVSKSPKWPWGGTRRASLGRLSLFLGTVLKIWSSKRAVSLLHLLCCWNCNVRKMFLGSPSTCGVGENTDILLGVLKEVARGRQEPCSQLFLHPCVSLPYAALLSGRSQPFVDDSDASAINCCSPICCSPAEKWPYPGFEPSSQAAAIS